MDLSDVLRIREDMERAAARRLQPHYIHAFFAAAFAELGGTLYDRELGRYQINNVPLPIRERNHHISRAYERLCFDKHLINLPGKPRAEFIYPGHPLLDSVIALILTKYQELLKAGAILVDATDADQTPRALYFLEQNLQDANGAIISSEVHFVEVDADGVIQPGGGAPYLDYRPPNEGEKAAIASLLERVTLPDDIQVAGQITAFAVERLIPDHLNRVQERRQALITRTLAAVQERLTREINHWDARANELRAQERAGKSPALEFR